MTSTIKVNTIQNTCGADIIKESSNTITIGASGDTVTLASGASQTGFGRTGTVDWQTTIKTGNFTASDGEGYFVNTTSGEITMTLPAGTAGAIVAFKDYLNTFDTNKLSVTPNGSDKIGGTTGTASFSTESQSVTLIFTDSTRGWVDIHDSTTDASGQAFISATGGNCVSTVDTNFKVHVFTSPGTFCVSAGSGPLAVVDYVVVAGGGGGGGGSSGSVFAAGGGGAGGYRESHVAGTSGPYTASPLASSTSIPVSIGAIPITVGAGGTGSAATAPDNRVRGTDGSNSIFSTITSAGGGSGGSRITGGCSSSCTGGLGNNGGSGGGSSEDAVGFRVGGSGNTPPVSPPQGNDGGNSGPIPAPGGGSGGGGASAAGGEGTPPVSNNTGVAGGAGVTSNITGSGVARAGGGASGGNGPGTVAAGGPASTGGGGAGGGPTSGAGDPGCAGTVNTGGGGGGSSGRVAPNPGGAGGNGGSGIVIIRYKFQ